MAKKRAGKAKPAKLVSAKGASSRVRKANKRQSKKLAKKEALNRTKMPNSFRLVGQVYQIFRVNWRILLGVVIVYLILNVIFASGFGTISSSISSIKNNLETSGQLSGALAGFSTLVGSAGSNSSQTGSILQSLLIVIESLVIIWALRQILAGKAITVKEAYYRSMTPFIPFLLVVAVIIIQLLPVVLGSAIAGTVLSVIFNSSATMTLVFTIIFILLASWSIYLLSSSIFAVYIVTLPDMEPLKALRSAKNLVHYRRWPLLRRLLFLPIFILLVMAVICVPLILYATFLVAPVFYFLSMVAILFIHTYLYSLYRSLLE